MKYSSVWVFAVAGVASGFLLGCSSSDFGSCEATYSCAPSSGGSAGSSGGGGDAAGTSGGSGASSAAGSGAGTSGAADGGAAGESAGGDTSNAGTSGGGSAGSAGATNGPPVLFGDCDTLGALACEAQASAQRLACDGKKWQAGTTCADGELCDSTDGACRSIVSECAAAKPGDVVCRTGDIPLTCGRDLVTASEGKACAGVCSAGTCVAPTCGDAKLEAGEQCDDGNTLTTDACTASCKTAVCGDGSLWAGKEACDDKNVTAGDGCSSACAWEPVAVDSYLHSCALGANGAVKCWGDNTHGQLGLGDSMNRGDQANEMGANLRAVDLGARHTAKQIAVGQYFSCALLEDDSVKCWGYNASGELGQGRTDDIGDQPGELGDTLKPIDLGAGRTARSIGVGNYHACALLDDSTVKCWGLNADGQLGQGHLNNIGDEPGEMTALKPVQLGSNLLARAIAVGGYHTCVILNDDGVKCWGANNYGQLGLGFVASRGGTLKSMGDNLPRLQLGGNHTAKAIAAGYSFTCAILDDDTLKCWGENSYGYLGQGNTTNIGDTYGGLPSSPPVDLGTGRSAKSIALGRVAACAVLDDGNVKCWGQDPLGLGDSQVWGDNAGEMGDKLPTIQLGTGQSVKQVSVGYHHMCALLTGGVIKCWGVNAEGELGQGNTDTLGDDASEMGDNLRSVSLVF